MDKYQRAILETEKRDVFFVCTSEKNSVVLKGGFDYQEDIYMLMQEEDIFSKKYEFVVKANSNIETCAFLLDGAWHNTSGKENGFSIELDFDRRIEKIKMTFLDNIGDDYIFSVQYVEADADLYYKKKEAERKENMLRSANIQHSTGIDLINIYFQPCCDEYEHTEVYLYIPRVDGSGGSVKTPSSWQMLKKYKVPAEDFYISINGLAYRKYAYVAKQFDKNNNLLLETEYQSFSITAPPSAGPPDILL